MNKALQRLYRPKRRVFFSFHYEADNWRASMIRNMGVLDGNAPVSPNSWEQVKFGGDAAIKSWIDAQIASRSCVVVLIGADTAERKWVRYEIKRAWESGKGVVGIYVHNLKDRSGKVAPKGINPFETIMIGGLALDQLVRAYDPPNSFYPSIYGTMRLKLEGWVEEAIEIRKQWS